MREYLNQARQLYMDLWAFHLESLLEWLKTASNRSMELGRKYKGTDLEEYACQRSRDVMDEVERIVKGR